METEAVVTLFVTFFGGGGLVSLLFKKLNDAHNETVSVLTTALSEQRATAALALAKSDERAEKWEAFAMDTFKSFQTVVQGFGQAADAVQTLAQK